MSALPYECESIRELLPAYAERTLLGRELARAEQHVASCQRCQREVADLRTVMSAVHEVAPDELPDTLLPRVRLAVRQRVPVPGVRVFWPRLAIPLAILTGAIAVGFALRIPRRQSAPGVGVALAPAGSKLARDGVGPGAVGGGGAVSGPVDAVPGTMGEAERAGAVLPQASRQDVAEPRTSPAERQMQMAAKPEELAGSVAQAPMPPPAIGAQEVGDDARLKSRALMDAPRAERGSAGRAGGGRGGVAHRGPRSGTPPAGPLERPRRHHMRGYGDRLAERDEAHRAGRSAKPQTAAEQPAGPPVFARASLVKGAGGSVIALEIAGEATADSITVRLGSGPPQTFQWRSAGARSATIPLPMDKLGPGPASVPVEVTSSVGKRDYVLFVPAISRLGEVAPTAPLASYQGAPLRSVLAELSALTGLVILAEQPLDAEIEGVIPRGTPEASLRRLGDVSGFAVQAQGDLVFTLTHRR